jgi:hypothetical protein
MQMPYREYHSLGFFQVISGIRPAVFIDTGLASEELRQRLSVKKPTACKTRNSPKLREIYNP